MRIAIIGGGIAGLAAAYELEKARTNGSPVEYTLLSRATDWAARWPRRLSTAR
jgi:protoporphyrinogen oxidase